MPTLFGSRTYKKPIRIWSVDLFDLINHGDYFFRIQVDGEEAIQTYKLLTPRYSASYSLRSMDHRLMRYDLTERPTIIWSFDEDPPVFPESIFVLCKEGYVEWETIHL